MSTTTAIILVGTSHPYHGGINPIHLIQLTENSRPALILKEFEIESKPVVIIPTIQNMADDVFLLISQYIFNEITPPVKLFKKGQSLYDLFSVEERLNLYAKSFAVFKKMNVKVVFNLLEGSTLLGHLNRIKEYPADIEITIPYFNTNHSSL